jgi:long-chain-alcohol oxidase
MKLTARQQHSLQLICDTFAPAADGWPSAAELGVPQAIADAMDFNPRRGDRKQFLQLLNFWDSQLHSVISLRRVSRFSTLSDEARVSVLLSWAESSLGRRRAAFQALRKAVSYLYVMLPRLQGARTPVWDKIGYPGPPQLGDRSNSSRALTTLVPQQETKLSCEICIIGSGAGGGTAAAVLAAAGKDVIILEAGGYYDDADFDGAELAATSASIPRAVPRPPPITASGY